MARKKLVYYYDTETCEYTRAEFNLKAFLKKVASYSAVGGVFAVIALFAFPSFIQDFKTDRLQKVNQKRPLIPLKSL